MRMEIDNNNPVEWPNNVGKRSGAMMILVQ